MDVINFGKENSSNTNTEKLEAFIKAVSNDENSHLVNVPPGPHILSDMVVSSAILGGAGPSGFGGPVATGTSAGGNLTNGGGVGAAGGGDTEEQMLAYALRISMEEAQNKPQEASKEEAKSEAKKEDEKEESKEESNKMELEGVEDDIDEEAELARAMAMSMAVDEDEEGDAQEASKEQPSGEAGADDDAILEVFKEEKFIEDLIDSTGVQKDDIDIQKIIDNNEKDEVPRQTSVLIFHTHSPLSLRIRKMKTRAKSEICYPIFESGPHRRLHTSKCVT